jgi:hypothetical protein
MTVVLERGVTVTKRYIPQSPIENANICSAKQD